MQITLDLLLCLVVGVITPAYGVSIKMDFLPLGEVRTDPLLDPTCLSNHVHTFYGAQASLRPETTYEDMRQANGNSGNVEENKSLYWHPSVYMFDSKTGKYTLAEIWFASAYYVWQRGAATAFPDGFGMIAYGSMPKARSTVICSVPQACEREDCSSDSTFFPARACAELEVKLVFPTCWDGKNLASPVMEHVSYDLSEEGEFDGECPSSHPVKLPEVHFYFRILNYPGGKHVFSDGTDTFHADYFSGWDQEELQRVLDECDNDSTAAMPDAFCEEYLTFRDGPKDGQRDDEEILEKLQAIQPPKLDLRTTVSPEAVTDITVLPRGACMGELVSASTETSGLNPTPNSFPNGGGSFNFGSGCAAGNGEFQLDLPDKAKTKKVGIIPRGKWDVRISLKAASDIDISLYDVEETSQFPEGNAVVAWCDSTGCNSGVLGQDSGMAETTYKGMTIRYSGYNGDGGTGNEWIEISGETSTTLMMRTFAYETGSAGVSYSWGASKNTCCRGIAPCGGSFSKVVHQGNVIEIGQIPIGKVDVKIQLSSAVDVDIQLYDMSETYEFAEGEAIIGWCKSVDCNIGLLGGPTSERKVYRGMDVRYSGYNGDGTGPGNEFIEIKGTTTRPLRMTAFGFEAGQANVMYTYTELDARPLSRRGKRKQRPGRRRHKSTLQVTNFEEEI